MNGITTVTQKGQVTIPVAIRNALGINPYDRVQIRMGDGMVNVEPVEDLLDLTRKWNLKAPKGKNAIKAREWMEKNYKRS